MGGLNWIDVGQHRGK